MIPRVEPIESQRPLRLAIVCPMANEASNAAAFVDAVLAAVRGESATLFVILDRVSTDGTRDILERIAGDEPALRVVWSPENRSVVDAYVRGYREALAADFDWILEIDAGFSHQPTEIARFLMQMRTDHWDCIFGSRFCRGGSVRDSSRARAALSWGGTQLSNLLLGTRLRDMTSGFQAFRPSVLASIVERGIASRGHFFQTEMKYRCRALRACEVPISYSAASPSVSGSSIRDALTMLARLAAERIGRTAAQ